MKLPTPSSLQKEATKKATLGDLMVMSVAGSGKTTTLLHMAKAISHTLPKDKKLLVAFNVAAVKELQYKLNELKLSDWSVKTYNGLGHATLMVNRFCGETIEVDAGKNQRIVNRVFKTWREEHKVISPSNYLGLLSRYKDDVVQHLKGMIPDSKELHDVMAESMAICKRFGVKPGDVLSKYDGALGMSESPYASHVLQPLVKKHMPDLLSHNLKAAKQGLIDFDDQIYLAILYCPFIGTKYDVIMADEFQDASFLNHQQIVRAAKKRVIVVGDQNQAIYQWRGAVADGMDLFAKVRPLQQAKLSVSYRVPEVVCLRQQKELKIDIQPHISNKTGQFSPRFYSKIKNGKRYWRFADLQGYTVLYRRNSTVLAAIACMLKEGFEDYQILASGPYQHFLRTVRHKPDSAEASFLALLAKSKIQLDDVFANKGSTKLMTIHASKGLEWEKVAYLDPSEGDGVCERYVAETRTKNVLAHLYIADNKYVHDTKKGLELAAKIKTKFTKIINDSKR